MSLTIEQLTDLTRCEECGNYHSQEKNCPVCMLRQALEKVLEGHKKQIEVLSAVVADMQEENQGVTQ